MIHTQYLSNFSQRQRLFSSNYFNIRTRKKILYAADLLTTRSSTNFAHEKLANLFVFSLNFSFSYTTRFSFSFWSGVRPFFFAVASKYFKTWLKLDAVCYYFGRHTHTLAYTHTHTADVYYWHSQPPTQAIMLPERSRTEIGRRTGEKKMVFHWSSSLRNTVILKKR